jgi:hypothetical protein
MCLDRTPDSDVFADWLLDVGAGCGLGHNNSIQLKPNMRMPDNSVQSLSDAIYPGIADGNKEDDYFLQRTILSPKNDAAPIIMIVKSHVFSTITNLTLMLTIHQTIPPLLEFPIPILLLLPPRLPKPFYNASPQSPKLFSTNYSKNVLVI